MMNIQTYLLNHSLADLKRDHGVNFRWSTFNPNKLSLNYDQLEARDDDIISQECRGLVLRRTNGPCGENDIFGESTVMAHPMHRFFNFGQECAAKVNFDTAKFLEKCDGTMILTYFDTDLNKWCTATRSVPDADLPVDGGAFTFRDLFNKALDYETVNNSSLFYYKLDTNLTYIFELCTPLNQIVVPYKNFQLFLLAVRNKNTGEEYDVEDHKLLAIPLAPTYNLSSIEDMLDFVSSRNPSEHEGLVMCDFNFNRVKVKNPAYVALNRIRDAVAKTPRAMLEVILMEKDDDVAAMLPEYLQKQLTAMKDIFVKYVHKTEEEYINLYSSDRKTFALAIQAKCPHNMSYFMSRWMSKCSSMKEWIHHSKKNGEWSNTFLDNLLICMEK